MIITITGKPCSGKGTVSKIFCQKYNFEYICTGDMFRELAKSYGYEDVLEFQKDEVCKNADKIQSIPIYFLFAIKIVSSFGLSFVSVGDCEI